MTAEQGFFLVLLRGFASGEAVSVPEELDWDALWEIARAQSLTGLCYVQLRALPNVPPEALERFHEGFFGDVYHAANRAALMEKLETLAQEQGIPLLPFKGWVVKDCWPVPELRTMGDMDVLIRTADRAATDAIMSGLGFQRLIDNHAVWTYWEQDVVFELHDHMFYEYLANDIDYRGYFDRAWDYAQDASFQLLYLLVHMAKHITNKGVGFRFFLDLVFFCRAHTKELSWPWIEEELKKLRLTDFAGTCFALCRAWFGVNMPLEAAELDPDFYAFVTDKMFRDGVFGLENEQNEASHTAKEIKRSKAPYWLTALDLTRRKLFPPYEDMQLIPWYSFVDGRPWLLPAAWVYRWGYCLIHKREQGEKLLAEPFKQRETVEKREKLIRDWGL